MAFTKMLWLTTISIPSWEYWATKYGSSNVLIQIWNYPRFYKRNGYIAYYAVVNSKRTRDNFVEKRPLFVSTDQNAVAFSEYNSPGGTTNYSSRFSFADDEGVTWYGAYYTRNSIDNSSYSVTPSGCVMNPASDPYISADLTPDDAMLQAAKDLVARIYSIPFQKDYQVGQTYTVLGTDIEQTIRKALGVRLWTNIADKGTQPYDALSENAESIISTLVLRASTDNFAYIHIENMSSDKVIYFYHGSMASVTGDCVSKSTYNGFETAELSVTLPASIAREIVTISSSGTVGYSQDTVTNRQLYPFGQNRLLVGLDNDSGNISMSNIGITL